jgi:hypothetical protein
MGSGKKPEHLPSGRAGLSMARAERLVAKTQIRGTRSPQAFVALGLATVAGMTAYGVLSGTGLDRGEDVMVFATAEAGAVAPAASIVTTATVPLETTVPTGRAVASAVDAEAVVQTSAAPEENPAAIVASADSPTVSTGCIDQIEDLLVSLQSSATVADSWSTQQDGLTSLVQATLDCESAGFRVAGSLELLGSGLADLKVHWDRESKVLDLAMIDRTDAPIAANDISSTDASSIEFLIR